MNCPSQRSAGEAPLSAEWPRLRYSRRAAYRAASWGDRRIGTATAPRGEVVRLIADQQVPRSVGQGSVAIRLRVRPRPGRVQELLEDVGHPQVVHRRDDAGEGFPGVSVDPQAAAKLEGAVGV